jgi:1,4-dihydroxy-6-naphthoate synthase
MAAKPKKTAAKKTSAKKGASSRKAAPKKKSARKASSKAKATSSKKATGKKASRKKAPAKKAAKKATRKKKPAAKKTTRKAAAKPEVTPAPADEAAVEAAPPRRKKPKRVPKMPARRADGTITVAASPDADDAFMFYALWNEKIDTAERKYEIRQEEIGVLNREAEAGTYDVTAISFGAYPYLADRYLLLSCGASFADGNGPVLIAKTPIRTTEVNGLTVAVPGRRTTAGLVLRLWLPHANLKLVPVPFDKVVAAVRTGVTRAGILIHEAQLTWREQNFVRVVDFGQWWSEKTEGLPLPLGANAIRRDIKEDERTAIALDIKRSIAYGLGHREETLEHAMKFAKGLSQELVDRYVTMYVNELSLDLAERGRQAVSFLYAEAQRYGLLPDDAEATFA